MSTINREQAIEQIQAWATDINNPKFINREDAIYILESLPSAERTGRWVTDIYKHGKDRHRCSECGEGSRESANYCPNCGARMRGESE